MLAIFKKEMINYFVSVIGYIFIAIMVAFGGYFYTTTSLNYANSDMRGMFNGYLSVLVFVIPILTMKLFSEEKKNKTDQSLMTLPVSAYEIVLGKFFAALSMFVISLSITLSYVLVVMLFGQFQGALVFGNYLAMILLSGVLISLGLMISSLTDNQIVSAVLSFFILFGSYSLGGILSQLKSQLLIKLLSFFAIFSHHTDFTYGVFGLDKIFYYLSLNVLFLLITTQVIEKKRFD